MKLSKRIIELKNHVEKGESVADVGTDHGYVPMLLVREGISSKVIMSDISNDSLNKAVNTFNTCGIKSEPEMFRCGNGLETLAEGEVDTVIIAGLGGHTIIDILNADINKTRTFKKLILQPRKHSGSLRCWLNNNCFNILEEALAEEGKFVCEIIVAEPVSSLERADYDEEDIRWSYPETLKNANMKLLEKRVKWKLNSISERIEQLSYSESDYSHMIEKLNEDYKYLKLLIDER